MVRTRLYFTSESHLHSLLSVLRYAAAETVQVDPSQIEVDMPALTAEAEAQLSSIKELNYMTHIVFRLFEIIPPKRRAAQRSRIKKTVPEGPEVTEPEIPPRFRISVGISPGVEVSTDEYGNYKQGVYGDMEEAAAAAAACAGGGPGHSARHATVPVALAQGAREPLRKQLRELGRGELLLHAHEEDAAGDRGGGSRVALGLRLQSGHSALALLAARQSLERHRAVQAQHAFHARAA